LALVREGIVVGLCSRLKLGIMLGARFGFALHSHSPAHQAQVERPLLFSDETPVREILDRSLARDKDQFHEDVVLLDANQNLLGLIPIDALARLQSRLVSEQFSELRCRHLELFHANNALRQSNGLYQGLFEGYALGVALLDPQGFIHEHNRRFTALINIAAEGTLRVSFADWVVEHERPLFRDLLDRVSRGRASIEVCEFTLDVPGRGARLFKFSPEWIGETGQICVSLDDVTDQRLLEKQMVRQEKQTLLDTLVGGIAHELNNKLTPVHGFAELIGQSPDRESREFAELIVRSVTEASSIIRQLLQLSKPLTSAIQLVDLRVVVEEALSMLRFQIRESTCALTSKMASAPVWVQADSAQVKQVVLNLVLNAMDALSENPGGSLEVEVATLGRQAKLIVSDSGCGIESENLNRIFDPFFTTKGPVLGTGLGLSICFSIVRQHGGDISVVSAPGAGARFTVALPLETTGVCPKAPRKAEELWLPKAPALPGKRVLVVDDEIVICRLMNEILVSRFGCQVDMVSNGIEALGRLNERTFTLIVSDIRMPGMSGKELFLWLNETQPETARRMILVTGHAGENDLEPEVAKYQIPVLMKPFSIEEFSEACAPFLNGECAVHATA
jgi:signal transduction histidine kinase